MMKMLRSDFLLLPEEPKETMQNEKIFDDSFIIFFCLNFDSDQKTMKKTFHNFSLWPDKISSVETNAGDIDDWGIEKRSSLTIKWIRGDIEHSIPVGSVAVSVIICVGKIQHVLMNTESAVLF